MRSSSGALVPLDTLVKFTRSLGPLQVNHSGQLPSATISFDVAPGVSLGKALAEVHKLAAATLPDSITTDFQGTAQAFESSLSGLGMLLIDDDPRHLPGAGRALRKFHPSDHDSLGTAVGRISAR